ncbi:MAG: DUF285 domain-containing protein [Succinivibrio sp.]|jgi:surface protein|nr:DUF285 domain-containing protein [Succinivibrio sp.]
MTVMITDTNKDFNKWIKIALRDLEKEHWSEAQEKISILKEENPNSTELLVLKLLLQFKIKGLSGLKKLSKVRLNMIKSTEEYPLIEKGEESQVKEHFLGIISRREHKLEHGKSSTSRLSAYIIPGLAVAILIFSAGAVVNDKFIKDKPYDYQPIDKAELRKLIKNKKVQLDRIDTSKITDMSYLFAKCDYISNDSEYIRVKRTCRKDEVRKDYKGIEKWNVSSVVNMQSMFFEADSFNEPIDAWDVSNVQNMKGMFYELKNFNQPLNSWNVSNVRTMAYMFFGASAFNQDISAWNVSKVENMSSMFFGAKSFNKPVEKWDVSRVSNMAYMFREAENFNQPLEKWDLATLQNAPGMFTDAKSFNQPLKNFDLTGVSSYKMFSGATSFKQEYPVGCSDNCSFKNQDNK